MDGGSSRYDKLESMLQDGSSEARKLQLEYLRNITNNFSDERLLGEGGFGTVYKGVLPNGEMIAVKKLNSSIPGVKDRLFENEACHLMRLKHPNVVLLVGWCSDTENIFVQYNGKYICAEKLERLLCLEYMPKGSLRGYLSDEASGLGWDLRYRIIKGICYGLHYLHEEWQHSTPIIHMDLKPANILLDNNMVPKIADFGLSRLFSEEKTWTCTINRDGTLGYMAPEYINRGLITTKSDIFSLGVIIIEIVTGHKDYPDENGVSPREFIDLVLKKWRKRLQKTAGYKELYYYQQIRRCIQIGLVCVDLDRSKRPTTSQIIKLLHVESVDLSWRKRTDNSEAMLLSKDKRSTSRTQSIKQISKKFENLTKQELTLQESLAAYRNAASVSNIQAALRERTLKLQPKAIQLAYPEIEAATIVAAMRIQHAFRNYNTKKMMRAAARIQSHFRTWQMRRNFMNMRRQAIKIQAAYRGHQVRRQYRKVSFSGVVEKAILRWRNKRKGLHGIATGMPVAMSTDTEAASTAEEDYYQVGRQQTEDRFNRSVSKSSLDIVHQTAYPHVQSPLSSPVQARGDWGAFGNKNHQVIPNEVPIRNVEHDDMGGNSLSSRNQFRTDLPAQVSQGDPRAVRFHSFHHETPSQNPPFKGLSRNDVLDCSESAEVHITQEPSTRWGPGDSHKLASGLEDANPSCPYFPTVLEEPSSSFSEAPDYDILLGIEGLRITGEAFPGREHLASGYPINGTTTCNFEWVRHLEDGSVNFIDGARQPSNVVTANDVETLLVTEVQPLDDWKGKSKSSLDIVHQTAYPHVQSPLSSPVQARGDWGAFSNKNHQVIPNEVPIRNADIDDMGWNSLSSRNQFRTDVPSQVSQGNSRAVHFHKTPSENPPFKGLSRNVVLDGSENAEVQNTQEPSNRWGPGDSTKLASGLEDANPSYPYFPTVLEEPGSSFSEAADDDPLPGIEGLRITGESFPGRELLASGYPINGITICNFEWVRHLEDGSVNFIDDPETKELIEAPFGSIRAKL